MFGAAFGGQHEAVLKEHVIAESDDIVCKGYQYFPPGAVQLQWLEQAPKTASDLWISHGVQFYPCGDRRRAPRRAAWCARPRPEMAQVRGRCFALSRQLVPT
jgi:uncharacterized protein (DUF427 family)